MESSKACRISSTHSPSKGDDVLEADHLAVESLDAVVELHFAHVSFVFEHCSTSSGRESDGIIFSVQNVQNGE